MVTPYGAVSSTCYGCRPYHFIGKRSAEPHGTGVAVHPGVATSFVGPTTYGYPHVLPLHYGKRSADAEPHGTGQGYLMKDVSHRVKQQSKCCNVYQIFCCQHLNIWFGGIS